MWARCVRLAPCSWVAMRRLAFLMFQKKKKFQWKEEAETDCRLLVSIPGRKTLSNSWRPAGTNSSGSLWGSRCPLAVSQFGLVLQLVIHNSLVNSWFCSDIETLVGLPRPIHESVKTLKQVSRQNPSLLCVLFGSAADQQLLTEKNVPFLVFTQKNFFGWVYDSFLFCILIDQSIGSSASALLVKLK